MFLTLSPYDMTFQNLLASSSEWMTHDLNRKVTEFSSVAFLFFLKISLIH